MTRKKVGDPERLVGDLVSTESVWSTYGFDITDLNLREESEDVEDIKLRCYRHNMILEGGQDALVLRKHRDMFIHQVVKAGFGDAPDVLNVIFEVIEYNKALNRCIVYIRTPCNFMNQRVPPMHSLDIAWGKYSENNSVNFFWSHRGENHMFAITKDNLLSCMKNPDLALGCNDKGELLLVKKDDTMRRLVVKDLHESITWRLDYRLSNSLRTDIGLKKNGYMEDWMEPGSKERKQAGRAICLEVMNRIIHEFLNSDGVEGFSAGDPYFCSRIDRFSKHQVQLIDRSNESGCVSLTFSSDAFERCTFRFDARNKYVQYIASQFYEANLEISKPENLMFDIAADKARNEHFIHQVIYVDFCSEADTAKDDPTLPVFLEEVILEDGQVQAIRNFNQNHKTNLQEKSFFVKWIGKPEHAFDVKEGKMVDNQDILLFFQHRGKNQQFCFDENTQSFHPLEKLDLAWGCRNGALKLVPRGSSEMIQFSNLSIFLQKAKMFSGGRNNEIGSMSRSNTEWESPLVMAYGLFSYITQTVIQSV